MTSPFTTPNIKSPERDFHIIKTDHPYMRAIGLGVFTTGDFITWMNQRKPDNSGVYKNRHLIRGLVDGSGTPIANPFDVVLGVNNEGDTDD